ncbi:MAG: TRAP transporter small permease [Nitratireductor sp.]|nr:TRAP transporter small permease [Nitratireductor sp.]
MTSETEAGPEAGGQPGAASAGVPGVDFDPPAGGVPQVSYSPPERMLIWLCLAAFCAMILAALGQVVFRYVLEIPVAWTEEAARVLFVLCMVMSIAFAYREHEHVVVDFLFAGFPAGIQRGLALVFNLCIVAFLGFWARGAWRLAELNWNSTLTTIPFFRVSYFYIWELAAIGLLFLYVLLDTRDQIAGRRAGPLGRDHDT